MQELLRIAFLVLVINQFSIAQSSSCSRITNFGEAKVCLPEINGYKECYDDSAVKYLADMTEMPTNIVLGFYLNNETHTKKDSLETIQFFDYFKVYGVNQVQNHKADNRTLVEMQKVLDSNYIQVSWDKLEKEIDGIGLNVKVGVPIVVDSYSLNDESTTYIMLVKYEGADTTSVTMAMSMSMLLLNDRLVFLAYYLEYMGEETILESKKQTDLIVTQLLSQN